MRQDGQASAFVGLDGVRGLAALTVFVDHMRYASFVDFGLLPEAQQSPAVAVAYAATRLGREAVLVFFVLSGFLVGGRLLRPAGAFDPARYAADRVSRILLPLIPAVILTALVDWSLRRAAPDPLQLAANMTGLNDVLAPTLETNAPLWSLSYEIWFYLLGGAAALLAAGKGGAGALAVLAAGVLVFSVLDARYLLFWMFGAAAFLFARAAASGLMFALGICAASFGVVARQLASDSRSLDAPALIPLELAEATICVGVAAALPYLTRERVDAALAPFAGPARFLSAISYTLYLTHAPISAALDPLLPRAAELSAESFALFVLRAVLCFAGALAMYWGFERHTPLLRRWLRARFAPR